MSRRIKDRKGQQGEERIYRLHLCCEVHDANPIAVVSAEFESIWTAGVYSSRLVHERMHSLELKCSQCSEHLDAPWPSVVAALDGMKTRGQMSARLMVKCPSACICSEQ